MEPTPGFVLYVNSKATAFASSLDIAQRLAARFVRNARPLRLRIESVDALAAMSQIWNYDHAAGLWVEMPDHVNPPSSPVPGDSRKDALAEESKN